jgi:eukaryotic-like serine/threonine-protein kinase
MSELQPFNTDAILGGQNPPPLNDAVLGGVAGTKRQIVHEWGLSEELVDRFSFETVTVNENAEIIDRQQKEAVCYTVDINGVPLELVYIPAGSFLMGVTFEWHTHKREEPIHLVTLQSFFMGKYPVTQKQYLALMDTNPSRFQGNDRHPVEKVSWENAMEFCCRLSKLTDKNFTLPSESQWEYACRAGTSTYFYFGQKINTDLVNFAGYDPNERSTSKIAEYISNHKTTSVGMYPPNSWGLYDMHGNVWEWCLDTYQSNYIGAPSDGSAWIDSDRNYLSCHHQMRGGSWRLLSCYCLSYSRGFTHYQHDEKNQSYSSKSTDENGFRICMVLNLDD